MNPMVLNSMAIIGGLILGGIVNMGIVSLGGVLVPPPAGADVSTMEMLKVTMHLFEPKHFIFPFLAHSIGTLVGAIFAAKVAATHNLIIANVIGVAFLAGGITMVLSLPSPVWFNALDLIVAYLPMAYLGYKLVTKND